MISIFDCVAALCLPVALVLWAVPLPRWARERGVMPPACGAEGRGRSRDSQAEQDAFWGGVAP